MDDNEYLFGYHKDNYDKLCEKIKVCNTRITDLTNRKAQLSKRIKVLETEIKYAERSARRFARSSLTRRIAFPENRAGVPEGGNSEKLEQLRAELKRLSSELMSADVEIRDVSSQRAALNNDKCTSYYKMEYFRKKLNKP